MQDAFWYGGTFCLDYFSVVIECHRAIMVLVKDETE